MRVLDQVATRSTPPWGVASLRRRRATGSASRTGRHPWSGSKAVISARGSASTP